MKKYIIKDTLHATEKNKNFAGQTRTYYLGVGGHIAGIDSQDVDLVSEAKHSGYTRLCDARRVQKSAQNRADWETNDGYWSHEPIEIVEVDV